MATRTTTRLVILGVLLASLFAALALRTVQLTVIQGADLAQAAEGNRTREVADPAPRGLILDSSGRPMVGNSPQAALAIADKTGQLQIFSTGDTALLQSILLHQQLIIMVGLQQLLLELILK